MSKLFRESFIYKDSQCTLISDSPTGIETAKKSIMHNRQLLENYIALNQKFAWTLSPLLVTDGPLVVKLMAQAAIAANVGPMAAVAGVLADIAVCDMIAAGCKVAVVEDGGEISATSNVPIDVAVAAGDEPMSKQFGFRLTNFPIGVATSSGRFSHAISFGDAEAVTVFCKTAGLADAAATAIGNIVKGSDVNLAIQKGINTAKAIKGVEGTLILYKGCFGTWGKIPQIIKIDSQI
jgi:ApbE superfamily uncharacterized protein (UPF0280 family)